MAQVIYDFKPNPLAGVGEAVGILGQALGDRWKQQAQKNDSGVLAQVMSDVMSGNGGLSPEVLQDYLSKMKTPEYQGVLNSFLMKQAEQRLKPTVLPQAAQLVQNGRVVAENPQSYAPQLGMDGMYTFNKGVPQLHSPQELRDRQDREAKLAERKIATEELRAKADSAYHMAMVDKLARDNKLPHGVVEEILATGARTGIDTTTPEGFVKARDLLKSEITNDPTVIAREAGRQAGVAVAQGIANEIIHPDGAAEAYQKLFDAAYNSMSQRSGPKTKSGALPEQQGATSPNQTPPPAIPPVLANMPRGSKGMVNGTLVGNFGGEYWVTDSRNNKIRRYNPGGGASAW
jgi:hypothetical protein